MTPTSHTTEYTVAIDQTIEIDTQTATPTAWSRIAVHVARAAISATMTSDDQRTRKHQQRRHSQRQERPPGATERPRGGCRSSDDRERPSAVTHRGRQRRIGNVDIDCSDRTSAAEFWAADVLS